MKLKTKIKKAVRRNERKMTTKKAKRALGTVAMAIFAMLAIQTFITVANSSKTITIENSKNWGVRESLENVADQSAMSTDKDGVVADSREETKLVEAESPSEVVRMIEEEFGDKAHEALAIAHCESRLIPDRVGDSNLAFEKDGQKYGESYGLFQIRSGGKGWVRTNNVEQFKKDMFTPEKNIKTAKKLRDAHGDWSPWYNCAVKNNLI